MDAAKLTPYFLVFTSLIVSTWAATAPSRHQKVVCLVEEDAADESLQDELFLPCSPTSVINVLSAIHGFQELPQDSKTCDYMPDTECSLSVPSFLKAVLNRCMGNAQCHVPVTKVFLDPCGKNSNYVQVEYECVPDNSVEPDNIVDICGEMLLGNPVSRASGYIKTPDYPEIYPPDISCSCNLTTLDSQGEIQLTLLDMQLEEAREACEWDWLEYTTPLEGWGRGVKMCQHPHGTNNTYTGNKTVLLNFRADDKVEDRGFWLRYEGRRQSGEEAEVMIQCNNFQPDIVHKMAVCITPDSLQEVYLNCGQVGVINILEAEYGKRSSSTGGQCNYPLDSACTQDAGADPALLTNCMGQESCNFPVNAITIPQCKTAVTSDYFQVKYQCVPDAFDVNNIVDICGDVLNGKSILRHYGHVESPNYPHVYPPNVQCQCYLSTDEDAQIQLKVLDVRLARDTFSDVCGPDWLGYTRTHAQAWGTGTKLCDKQPGKIIDTGAHEIRLDFLSDSNIEERGFWIQYSAVRDDGLHVAVQLTCRKRRNGPIILDSEDTAKPLRKKTNTGLVIGLSLIGLLITAILILMVILRYKKVIGGPKGSRNGKLPTVTESAEATTPLDKSYTGLKKYSTLSGAAAHQPYHTLHNEGHLSRARTHQYVENNPDYELPAPASANLPPASYINPAFDGTLGSYNVAC